MSTKKSIEDIFPNDWLNEEGTNKLENFKIEQKIKREDLLYKAGDTKKVGHVTFQNTVLYDILEVILNGTITLEKQIIIKCI